MKINFFKKKKQILWSWLSCQGGGDQPNKKIDSAEIFSMKARIRLLWHLFFLRLLQGPLTIIEKLCQVREVDQNAQSVDLCRRLTCRSSNISTHKLSYLYQNTRLSLPYTEGAGGSPIKKKTRYESDVFLVRNKNTGVMLSPASRMFSS